MCLSHKTFSSITPCDTLCLPLALLQPKIVPKDRLCDTFLSASSGGQVAHGLDGHRVAGVDSTGAGKAVSLCAAYKSEFCVKTTETLDRHRVFAVLAFNKDLIGDTAEAKLEPCRRFAASRLAAGNRPAASDPVGLDAVSMIYARPVFTSIGLSVGLEALDLIVSMAQPVCEPTFVE